MAIIHFNWREIATYLGPTEAAVGSGSSGKVLKGIIPDENARDIPGCQVVLKMNSSQDKYNKIKLEKEVLEELDHDNIIKLIGWSEHKEPDKNGEYDQMCLVLEFMPKGALSANMDALTFKQLLKILMGMARGIQYLHDRGYIHHDLKPENILVTQDFDAKIIDLGGANKTTTTNQHWEHTTGFHPVLDIAGGHNVTRPISQPRSDTFAFGVIMIQLITKNRRVSDTDGKHISVIMIDEGENAIRQVHRSYYEQDCNKEMATEYLKLATTLGYTRGYNQSFNPPAHTPTWAEVIHKLQEIDLQREEEFKLRTSKKKMYKVKEKVKRGIEKISKIFKKN